MWRFGVCLLFSEQLNLLTVVVIIESEIWSAEVGSTSVKEILRDELGLEESREILSTKIKQYFWSFSYFPMISLPLLILTTSSFPHFVVAWSEDSWLPRKLPCIPYARKEILTWTQSHRRSQYSHVSVELPEIQIKCSLFKVYFPWILPTKHSETEERKREEEGERKKWNRKTMNSSKSSASQCTGKICDSPFSFIDFLFLEEVISMLKGRTIEKYAVK